MIAIFLIYYFKSLKIKYTRGIKWTIFFLVVFDDIDVKENVTNKNNISLAFTLFK